ncbi:MAG: Nif3-like dinuclear metal center hexameric protein, partial [Actinomyces sp.]|nr:Nif3-like dinuclear metal center hexameric protein [Actinomyces sp.]
MTKWNVGDVRSLMNQWYPPESAHGWDKVGLITGAPQAQVDRILLALDPTQAVVEEALQWGANMIITHHPLLLRG